MSGSAHVARSARRRGGGRRWDRRHGHRHGIELVGVLDLVDRLLLFVVVLFVRREVVGLRVEGNGATRGGLHRSIGAEVRRDHERLAGPQRGERAPDVPGGRGGRPSGRGQRHAGRHQDGHEDHGDEDDGGAGGAEAAVQRTADGRAEIAAGVLRARSSSRTTASPWPARPGRRCRARRAPSRRPGARGPPPRAPRPRRRTRPDRAAGPGRRRRPRAGAGRVPSPPPTRGRSRCRDRWDRVACPRGPGRGGPPA